MDATRTVLLAEDEALLRETLAALLAQHGYEVVAVGSGTEAVAAAADRMPDLAILDMMLPGESGFHVTRVVKDLSAGRVPVIMMSGNTSAAHRDYALASGVDSFLAKPFDPARLLELIDSLCPPVPRVVFRAARRAALTGP
jgi:DNA-binding response OmpR family regulator